MSKETNDIKLFKDMADGEKISHCDKLATDSKGALEKRHFEWYLNYSFIEGEHYATYNSVTNALERPPRKRGEVRMVINKVRSSLRAIKNYSTRFQPKWEIIPGDVDEETIANARRCGKFLDYLYRHLHLEIMIKGVVDPSLNTSVGWVELGWDEKAEDGLGQILVKNHDSFDIFPDPRGFLYGGKFVGRYIIKSVRKSVEEVQHDKKYDYDGGKARKRVVADEELSESTMKARIIRRESGAMDSETIKRVNVREFFIWEDEKNEKGGNIRLFTYAGKEILRDEPLPDREFPLYPMQIPQDPLKLYHRAWTSDAIPLNKALDRTVSQKIMLYNQAIGFKILAEKGHGINTISNEGGEIMEINKGRSYQLFPFPSIPVSLDSLPSELSGYMEDILGAHDAAVGNMPAGVRSGDMLESLQAADANNLVDIRESLESFLSVIGSRILDIAAEKYVTSRIIKITEPEEGQEYLKVIGESAPAKLKGKGNVLINKDNEVIVKIGSWLGHTPEAQRDTLFKMAELKIIPGDEVLRQFEFANINELSEKAKGERLEQHELDAEIAGRNGEQGGGVEMGAGAVGIGGDRNKMVQLADKENTMMANGQRIPSTEGATPEHTQAHIDFVNSQTFGQLSPDIQNIIVTHYQGEIKGGGQGAVQVQ